MAVNIFKSFKYQFTCNLSLIKSTRINPSAPIQFHPNVVQLTHGRLLLLFVVLAYKRIRMEEGEGEEVEFGEHDLTSFLPATRGPN